MTRSNSKSVKTNGFMTPIEEYTSKNLSRNARSRESDELSLQHIYCELKKKGLYNGIPTRFVVALIAALANTFSYILRTNMSVTIVEMIADKTNENNRFANCSNILQNFNDKDYDVMLMPGQFIWDETKKGIILASFYIGYIVANIGGGPLADKFGSRWLCAIITLISAILTLLTELVANLSIYVLILSRVGIGLFQGILSPAIYSLLANWIPRNERGFVLALIQVGGNMGAVISIMLSGFLCKFAGWQSVFYIFGIYGLLFCVLWIYTIYDTPFQHPRIRDDELLKIKLNIDLLEEEGEISGHQARHIPWIAIWTSIPVWAIAVAKFCGAWGNLMLMSELPSYLKSVLNVTIQESGYITSGVYIALSISVTGFGYFSDWLGQKQLISTTLSRKIFETIALGGPAICLAIVPSFGCNLVVLIALLVVAMIVFGFNAAGDKPIVIEIAPAHSGTIYGITNAFASLPGILAPMLTGHLVENYQMLGWNIVFYSASGIYIFGLLFFLLFVTAKPQPWATVAQPKASDAKLYWPDVFSIRMPTRRATFMEGVSAVPTIRTANRRSMFRHTDLSTLPTLNFDSTFDSTEVISRNTEIKKNINFSTIDLRKSTNSNYAEIDECIDCTNGLPSRLPPSSPPMFKIVQCDPISGLSTYDVNSNHHYIELD